MYRDAIVQLTRWKNSSRRKPLIIQGARQVGKTWLLREFGRTEYSRTVYVSLDASELGRRIFTGNLDPATIVEGLSLLDGNGSINPDDTLIVLDEIQEAPRALTALKYFAEDAPEYHVACAGSLLGVALHEGTSFPVGKVDFLPLHPMSFTEFLAARGQNSMLQLLTAGNWGLIDAFHPTLAAELRRYLIVGGMPTAVATLVESDDYDAVRNSQLGILAAYENDFSKHAPNAEVPRLRAVFGSVPSQLAKENRKYIYSQAWKGARAATLEMALLWLSDTDLVHQIHRITAPRNPLTAYSDRQAFKLFLLDVGLLGAMAKIDSKTLLNGNALFTEFKGAMTEQYVAQTLSAMESITAGYWNSDSGTAEMDFVIQHEGQIVPIEVKAETNLKAKSLKVYRDRFAPPIAIRTSLAPYHAYTDGLIDLPLYALSLLPQLLKLAP